MDGERQKLMLVLLAPLGITFMGLLLGITQMFVAGLALTVLVLAAAVLHSKS